MDVYVCVWRRYCTFTLRHSLGNVVGLTSGHATAWGLAATVVAASGNCSRRTKDGCASIAPLLQDQLHDEGTTVSDQGLKGISLFVRT